MFSTLARISAAALLGLGLVTLTAIPSQAHSQLVSSSPANGAALTDPPSEIVFTFDENLLPDLDTISINNDQGVNVTSQQVEPVGNTLSMPWTVTIEAGTYQVAYRIVSGDGHPVTGAISFTFGTSRSPLASQAPSRPTETSTQESAGAQIGTIVSLVALIAAVLSIVMIVVLVKRNRTP